MTTAPDRIDSWLDARRRLAWALMALFMGIVAVIVVVPHAIAPGGISPIDEYDYVDALDKADHWEVVNRGEKIDQYARQVQVCRGLLTIMPPAPDACGLTQSDTAVPRNGYSAADIHAPTYFFLTAVASKFVRAAGITDDLLIAGRLVGALWLALGLLAMVALGRAWGARWVMPALVAAAVAASPLVVSVSAYISPDALGLLVGALVLLAVTQWQRGRLHWSLLALTALLPAFVKVPFVLAALFGAVLLLVAGLTRQTPWRRVLVGSTILVVGSGAGAVLWNMVRIRLTVGNPTAHPDGPPATLDNFIQYVGYYLQVIPGSSGGPVPEVSTTLAAGMQPLVWLLLVAALGGMLVRRRDDPLLPVCWAGMSGMVLGSIVMSLIVLVSSGGGFLIGTPRYGIALLPLFTTPLMCLTRPLAVLGVLVSALVTVLTHLVLW